MKILLVADGRSPITRQWVKAVNGMGHTLYLASTFPCEPVPGIEDSAIIPVAFSNMAGTQVAGGSKKRAASSLVRKARKPLMHLRYWLGPLTLPKAGDLLANLVNRWKPDLVHALRIPFEGMLASYTPKNIPLAVSIWGNDLTLHTRGSSSMRRWTRRAVERADGLLADAPRDIRLSSQWGFDPGKPALVVPGSGGIDLAEINTALQAPAEYPWLKQGRYHIINPRGLRPGYINTREFFAAIPLVLEQYPESVFLCPGMQGQEEAEGYARQYRVERSVELLPYLSQAELWQLFSRCEISASISTHDGTPNTLLEAMACGSFPVAGDLESLRDWITPGVNGFLVDPYQPVEIARAILSALDNTPLRQAARLVNIELVKSRASREAAQNTLQPFFEKVLSRAKGLGT
ncbi:MAG TPA: glycosyltransferase family 4 protein [Anaerolineaceae bacterium]|nr:glycosyltransferase family 4 protein [Anaerolineaceae bacterium]HQP07942.1 glycosyltransferase family 4 protein [Anaerolineaceae bacterium]